jgi:hypothetical protein
VTEEARSSWISAENESRENKLTSRKRKILGVVLIRRKLLSNSLRNNKNMGLSFYP